MIQETTLSAREGSMSDSKFVGGPFGSCACRNLYREVTLYFSSKNVVHETRI